MRKELILGLLFFAGMAALLSLLPLLLKIGLSLV